MRTFHHPSLFVLTVAFVIRVAPIAAQDASRGQPDEVAAWGRSSLTSLKQAADAGQVSAMTALGLVYRDQWDVPGRLGEARRWLQKASEKGYAAAQCDLGVLLLEFFPSPEDAKSGVNWLESAAAQNWHPASEALGRLYSGVGSRFRDPEKAIQALVPAAKDGDPGSQLLLAQVYEHRDVTAGGLDRGNRSLALEWYEKAAAKGVPDAQTEMGLHYLYDLGPNPDPVKASGWLRLAAKQGMVDAMVPLARSLLAGKQVPSDREAEAVRWLEKASAGGDPRAGEMLQQRKRGLSLADQPLPNDPTFPEEHKKAVLGNVDSMLYVAEQLRTGGAVPRDEMESVRWFRTAAEKGSGWAMLRYGAAIEAGRGATGSKREAAGWYERAARAGVARGDEELLRLYALGLAPVSDRPGFASWLNGASGHIFPRSAGYLGELYWRGDLVPRDPERAMTCYVQAAQLGDALAQNRLGEMHLSGQGGITNHQEALYWLRASAQQDWPPAQLNLARMYAKGLAVATNLPKAWILSSIAAERKVPGAAALSTELGSKLDSATLGVARRHLEEYLLAPRKDRDLGDWHNYTSANKDLPPERSLIRPLPQNLFP